MRPRPRPRSHPILALALATLLAAAAAAPEPLAYPPTRRGDVVDDYFGTKIADPYRWLEDDRSPETEAWVKAQDALTAAWLAKVPERAALRKRLSAIWDYERFSAPRKRGKRFFYSRNAGLQDQAVQYVTDDPARPGHVLLDPNRLSKDGTVALSGFDPTDDGRLVAYALSEAGSDWDTWHVRDVATGKDLPDVLRWSKFASAAWRKDGAGFWYDRFDPPLPGQERTGATKNQQIWWHRLGTLQSADALVYARPDHPEWYLSPAVTDDGRWLVISASEGTNPETSLFLVDLRRPGAAPEPFLDRMDASYEVVDDEDQTFFVVTNQGAPRKRLVAIERGKPDPKDWRELIPESKRDVLEQVSLFGDRFVAVWMRDAHHAVEVWDVHGRKLADLDLPTLGTVAGFDGKRRDRETFYVLTSFTAPPTIWRLDVPTLESRVFRRPRVAFDGDAYETEQVFFPSRDGTQIPMFLVHRREESRDGARPTLLTGYGGFDVSLTPWFSPGTALWLEMGGVLAVANLRGGGEYGKGWYDAGRLAAKQNVFDDFIAAAQWLEASGWTSSARLAIEGASNGGLLVGAALTQRPDLFGAAVPQVGVLDMLRFHRFTVGWGWKSDYGSSETREGFETLLRYSPLHAVRAGTRYPPTLVMTADHDDRVVPAHSFKFLAALQAAQAGPAPILARIERRAGHGAGKPTSKRIDETVDEYAFLVKVLGIELPPSFSAAGTAPRP
ncbi:MAG TPA: prolyl oligopeptidase family serine peptidase [Anaeromyxobacteraceae bacterium]|nr:prolyl oligopeptidase family serine peptidase [Anaeromyxobacteraceae bacterium]